MCNAWNHPPGCTCGFGGEGHLGGGRGWGGGGSATIKTYPFHSSMRDLCQELGHSLVVPTNCRHCGRLIYLYANPHGGFAIFDELGKPWPKHLCGLVSSTTREYYSLNTVFSSRHRLPVPDRTEEGSLQAGQSIRGTVTAVEDGRIEVFDGTRRYWVVPSCQVPIGQVVEGSIRSVQGNLLFQLAVVPLPGRDDLAASDKSAAAAEGPVMDVAKHNEFTNMLGRWFKKRVKIVWGVFSNTNHLVATFEYPRRAEAEAYAAELSEERRAIFYVNQVRQFMD